MSLTEHERKVVIKDFDSVAKVLFGKHEIPFLLHMDILKSFSEFSAVLVNRSGWTKTKMDLEL
jgi:hypothetical protein